MPSQKRVLAIHDISCFGRCSLTVALPILSAAGIETPVIPTAVLSTHTGGFTGFTYRDLTEDILPIADHWKKEGLEFDAIYTGFLGSFAQIDIVLELIRRLKTERTMVVVDPAMADDGRLYSVFPPDFPNGMRRLCAAADVMVPNMTEAALLLGRGYHAEPYTRAEIEEQLRGLCALGAKNVVLTGVSFDNSHLGAASYNGRSGKSGYAEAGLIDGMYHGTGDIFASALVAALVSGTTLEHACEVAVRFTVESIARTRAAGTDKRFGVDFESGLAELKGLMENGKWKVES